MAVAEQCGRRQYALLVQCGALARIGGLAGGILGQPAVEALATGNHKRDHHAITGFHLGHAAADLFHHAHEFVAQHIAIVQVRNLAPVQVQVRTTDGGGGHPQDQIILGRQHRVRHGLDAHIPAAVIGQCLHRGSPERSEHQHRRAVPLLR